MKLFSIDVGYVGTKYCLYEKDIKIIPSFIREINPQEATGKNILEYKDRVYLVGEAAREAKSSEFTLVPRAEDENTFLLMMAAMGQTLSPDDEILVCTGLPDKEHSLYRDELIEKIKQLRKFKYNGVEFNIAIKDVKVNKQSKGAFYSVLFNVNGEMNEEYESLKIGIAEMGWRTLLLSQIIHLQYMEDYSSTEELGMYHVGKDLAKLIYQKYRVQFFPEQLEEVIKNGQLRLYGEYKDVSDLVQQCFHNHFAKIKKIFANEWPNLAKLDGILFAGGSMQPLYEPFLLPMEQFAHNSTLLDRFAVLRGYHRSGLYQVGGEVENAENGLSICPDSEGRCTD